MMLHALASTDPAPAKCKSNHGTMTCTYVNSIARIGKALLGLSKDTVKLVLNYYEFLEVESTSILIILSSNG